MPLESSAYYAVSLLEQEKHRQHAEEEKRRSRPRHVVYIDDQVADLTAYRNCVRKSKPTAKSFAMG